MEIIENVVVESSNQGTGTRRRHEEAEKHVMYSDEQTALLEKIFVECPNPTRSQRSQIMQEHLILNGIENRQLKFWFQNCRYREKKKKENEEFLLLNRNLSATNNMLAEVNNLLQNEVAQLMQVRENLRNLLIDTDAVADLGHEPEAFPAEESLDTADNIMGINSINKNSTVLIGFFLSLCCSILLPATGTVTNWITNPRLKVFIVMLFGLYLLVSNHLFNFRLPGAVHVSLTCIGEAARASTTAPFDPTEKMEILKDCPSWFPNYRNLEGLDKFLVNNGTTIEPVYTQNVFPKKLVRLLKEHHPEWMDFNFDAHSAALLKAGLLVFQGLNTLHVVERKMLLGNTTNGNERDGEDTCLPGADSSKFPCLMFIVAYQFSFSTHLQEDVASMAQQYVYHVILSQKSISLEVTSGSYLVMNSTEPKFSLNSIHAVNLANWIGQSYRSTLGVEFLSFNCQSSDSLLEHSSSFTSIPVCLHANQPALYVQEGMLENLQALEMDKLFDDSGNISLQSDVPTIVHQGSQYFLLVTEHNVLYGQAVVQIIDKRNGPVECVALALIN